MAGTEASVVTQEGGLEEGWTVWRGAGWKEGVEVQAEGTEVGLEAGWKVGMEVGAEETEAGLEAGLEGALAGGKWAAEGSTQAGQCHCLQRQPCTCTVMSSQTNVYE